MTKREICERLMRIAREISSSRRRISNEKDVYKSLALAISALDSAHDDAISIMLSVEPHWTAGEKEDCK